MANNLQNRFTYPLLYFSTLIGAGCSKSTGNLNMTPSSSHTQPIHHELPGAVESETRPLWIDETQEAIRIGKKDIADLQQQWDILLSPPLSNQDPKLKNLIDRIRGELDLQENVIKELELLYTIQKLVWRFWMDKLLINAPFQAVKNQLDEVFRQMHKILIAQKERLSKFPKHVPKIEMLVDRFSNLKRMGEKCLTILKQEQNILHSNLQANLSALIDRRLHSKVLECLGGLNKDIAAWNVLYAKRGNMMNVRCWKGHNSNLKLYALEPKHLQSASNQSAQLSQQTYQVFVPNDHQREVVYNYQGSFENMQVRTNIEELTKNLIERREQDRKHNQETQETFKTMMKEIKELNKLPDSDDDE